MTINDVDTAAWSYCKSQSNRVANYVTCKPSLVESTTVEYVYSMAVVILVIYTLIAKISLSVVKCE